MFQKRELFGLGDAMRGDPTRFAREDYVEEAWRIVDPILGNIVPVQVYEAGSWGPRNAGKLVSSGAWRDPYTDRTTAHIRSRKK